MWKPDHLIAILSLLVSLVISVFTIQITNRSTLRSARTQLLTSDRRELRAVLDESAQHLAGLTSWPSDKDVRQLERDNVRLLLRLGSDSTVSQTYDDAVEAARQWGAIGGSTPRRIFNRRSKPFFQAANRLARSEFRAP
jgi:hypothetical protein